MKRWLPIPIALILLAPATAHAQEWFDGLSPFQISLIETDIEWVFRRSKERQAYLKELFRLNHKKLTGTPADVATFADLVAGESESGQRELVEQIVPIPSREFVEILGSGHGRELLARCPIDPRGYADCH